MQTELYPEPPVVILWPQDRPAFRREYSPSSFDGTVMIVNVRPGRYDELARYAMIVTIRTPGSDVDIYAPVEAQVAIAAEIGADEAQSRGWPSRRTGNRVPQAAISASR
jgi:hypothetical protein